MSLRALLGSVLIVATAPIFAADTIRLRVSPQVCSEPARIIVQATIEPDAANRALSVEIDSETFYRSSQIELAGASAPRTSIFRYHSLPAGEYEVRVTLLGQGEHPRAVERRSLMVMP